MEPMWVSSEKVFLYSLETSLLSKIPNKLTEKMGKFCFWVEQDEIDIKKNY